MKKKEIVLREVIHSFFQKQPVTQLELSKRLNFSLSTVNNAVSPLAYLGAFEIRRTGIRMIDLMKSIIYLASIRNLNADILYRTNTKLSVTETEKSMPKGAIYTAFSGYKFLFDDVPADYSEVYVYADEDVLQELRSRFPETKGNHNLFVLKADQRLIAMSKNNIVPPVQLFIDLWNLKEWYAKEFVNALSKRLGLE